MRSPRRRTFEPEPRTDSKIPDPSIYLDYNATTPVLPAVVEAVARAMGPSYANPSSLHARGRAGRALLEESREAIVMRLGGGGGELVFTSGGSESNRLAILTALEFSAGPAVAAADGSWLRREGVAGPPHAVVSAIDHPSTLEVYRRLEERGMVSVTRVAAGEDGRVAPGDIQRALRPHTVVVSILHANNETGVIQDIPAVSSICREKSVILHSDAVQSLGKVAFSLDRLGADLVTISAHKVYGPKGVGALWARDGIPVRHFWGGGPQEKGRRPGTENLPGAVGFATALEHLEIPGPELRDRLWNHLREACPGAVVNGARELLVPNTLNVSFTGVRAETLLIRLDLEGVQASSGSACSSGAREPSHVLAAMGLPPHRIDSAVRFSLGRQTTVEEVDRAGEVIARCAGERGG